MGLASGPALVGAQVRDSGAIGMEGQEGEGGCMEGSFILGTGENVQIMSKAKLAAVGDPRTFHHQRLLLFQSLG